MTASEPSMDPPELKRSLDRWLIAGAFVLVALIAAFPAYKAVESARRDDSLARRQSALLLTGGELWADNCASCHGPNGEGPGAPALNSQEFLGETPDRLIHHVIQAGVPGSAMPAWWNEFGGPLTDDEITAIVAYLRNWERTAPSVPDWRNPGQADAAPSPPPEEGPDEELPTEATITIDDQTCEPAGVRVAAGRPFTLIVHNEGTTALGVELVDFHVHIDTGPGETVEKELTPLDPGEYRFECLGVTHNVLNVGKILAGRLPGKP